jgi:hypothetical protein
MRVPNWLTVGCLSVVIGCSSSSRTQTRDPIAPDSSGGTGGSSGAAGSGAVDAGGGSGGSAGTAGTAGTAGAAGTSGSGGAACNPVSPRALSETPGKSTSPVLVWTQNGYAAAWTDERDGNPEVYFARLDSQGNKLGGDVRVTSTPGISETPDLAWASSELGMVWSDQRDGNSEIYFVRLDPAGTKLGAEVRVTSNPARSEFPSLVQFNNGYAVAWNDTRDGTFQIYLARLQYDGTKIGVETRVSTGTALSASPSLAASSSGFGVAWHDLRDPGGLQIYFARLDPTGARIGNDVRLSALGLAGGEPSVASSGGGYGIVWSSTPGSGGEAQWVSVNAGGTVSGNPVALTSTGNTAGSPALVARDMGYAIAWPDGRDGDNEINVAELDLNGTIVGTEIRVSNDAIASVGPSLARTPLGYGVAWTSDPTQTSGEVHFATVCR